MKKAAASDAARVGASSPELQPEQTQSRLHNGEMDLRNLDAARREFALVVRREPPHAGTLTSMAVIDYPSADCEGAREKLVRSAVTEPCCQKPHYFYGLTLTKPGNKARAEPELEIAPALQQRRSMPAAVLSGGNP
ncbi:MAG TPA: hypothetical protein VLN59_09360 [Burkholderiales bacterium]|nr:hypothetical protein [Burkholderiales bacterium]